MNYDIEINGIPVHAVYTEDNINKIFIPLLKKLTDLQSKSGRRILVMLAAPPGAGKSTLCAFLQHLSETTSGIHPIQAIGMDGFHRYQDYLTTHTTVREGKELLMVDIKGAPITFDLELLTSRIEKITSCPSCGWPTYNRLTHNPSENAITVTGDIILLEGNYLLLEQEGWKDLKSYADYTIKITADEEHLRSRLIERKVKSGASREDAVAFVESSDLYNARTCLNHSGAADLELRLNHDNSYSVSDSNIKKDVHRYSSEPDIPDCGCIYG